MLDPAAKLMRGLTEALVLESLEREPKHGYALMTELEDVFGEAPNRNRIYPLLSRLEEEGHVEGREDPDSSRGKTTYTLTESGEDRLEAYRSMPPSFRDTLDRFWGPTDSRAREKSGENGDDAEEDDGEDPERTQGSKGDESGEGPDAALGPLPPGAVAEGGPDGVDLRRNPETGALELVVRGTPWGPIRLQLGDAGD